MVDTNPRSILQLISAVELVEKQPWVSLYYYLFLFPSIVLGLVISSERSRRKAFCIAAHSLVWFGSSLSFSYVATFLSGRTEFPSLISRSSPHPSLPVFPPSRSWPFRDEVLSYTVRIVLFHEFISAIRKEIHVSVEKLTSHWVKLLLWIRNGQTKPDERSFVSFQCISGYLNRHYHHRFIHIPGTFPSDEYSVACISRRV